MPFDLWLDLREGSLHTFNGVLRDGLGVAQGFTELDWVREYFRDTLGLDVYPGTVNLQLDDPAELQDWAQLRKIQAGMPIVPPDTAFCAARAFAARIDRLPAAVVFPHVAGYPPDKLEVLAAVRVRDALGLQPGDQVQVTIDCAARTANGAITPAALQHLRDNDIGTNLVVSTVGTHPKEELLRVQAELRKLLATWDSATPPAAEVKDTRGSHDTTPPSTD